MVPGIFHRKKVVRLAALIGAFGLVAVLPGAAIAAPGEPNASAPATEARTTSGWVGGYRDGSVATWAGIPYAAPPVGGLRWRPPVAPVPWSSVRPADEFAAVCTQLISETEVIGSEDCLYLNVFAPLQSRRRQLLPVMVHLHGGGNSGFHPYTNADAFVERGVVVVTVGYRLGVFGFVGHPALSGEDGGSSGEYGLLDQIAALEWVRDNIAQFGGDPSNVTIFGESAGSFDAAAMVVSPLSQGLIHKAALQTEAWWALVGGESIVDAEAIGLGVARQVGCKRVLDAAACLRGVPATNLVLAAGFLDVVPWVGGQVLPKTPLELMSDHPPTIPMLVGSNQDEAAFWFTDFLQGSARYKPQFWLGDTDDITGAANGATVRSLYPPESHESLVQAAVAVFTDAIYGCPMRRLALASNGPVFRYLYTHSYDNNGFYATFGASHFLDDPLLWHDPQLLSGFGQPPYFFSGAEERLSANMTTYWTNFAKQGDPNGLDLPEWPLYNEVDERTLLLEEPLGVTSFYRSPQCDFFDAQPELFPSAR